MTVTSLPEGMTIIDGVPAPVYVNGIRVKSAKRAAEEGVHYGRTNLTLENNQTTQGCVDCRFTHPHWAALARHRHEEHGADVAWRNGWATGARATKEHTQLELTAQASDGPPVIQRPTVAEARPAIEAKRILSMPSEILTAFLSMTLDEVFATAGSSFASGKALEEMTKDRDYWRSRYKALEREVKPLIKLAGKTRDVLNNKDGD